MATYDVEISDVEYLKHGDAPLMAKLFKPKGTGPFPIMIELHGGAWATGNRTMGDKYNEALAKKGHIVVTLDFRTKEKYPNSVQDIHYAVRWAKTQAESWGGRPDKVGIMGISSGAHQAMLLGMRPNDSRYAALPSPPGAGKEVDGTTAAVIMVSPVIDPLGRYEYAQGRRADGLKPPEGWPAEGIPKLHDRFWGSEEAMVEGSPTRILKRGEKTALPPTFTFRFKQEDAHPLPDYNEFVAEYRKAGGQIEDHIFDGKGMSPINDPKTSGQVIDEMDVFIKKHLSVKAPATAGSGSSKL